MRLLAAGADMLAIVATPARLDGEPAPDPPVTVAPNLKSWSVHLIAGFVVMKTKDGWRIDSKKMRYIGLPDWQNDIL